MACATIAASGTSTSLTPASEAIAAECKRRGWEIVETIEDRGYSARDLKRPGIQVALEALSSGEARALVVAKSTASAAPCSTSPP